MKRLIGLLMASTFAISACQSQQQLAPQLLGVEGQQYNGEVAAVGDAHWLIAGSAGLTLISRDGRVLDRFDGIFELVDARSSVLLREQQVALAMVIDVVSKAPTLVSVNLRTSELEELITLTTPGYQVEGLCLYRDNDENISVFFLDGAGRADQRLIYDGRQGALMEAEVRTLIVAPDSEYCSVDDQRGHLYLTEESFGLWRYSADAEAEQQRELIDAVAPYGSLGGVVSGVATTPAGPVVVTPDTQQLHFYNDKDRKTRTVDLKSVEEPDAVALHMEGQNVVVAVSDDEAARVVTLSVELPSTVASSEWQRTLYPKVYASAQTDPVNRFGDAADDPAVWINSDYPEQSLILGSDKKWGLRVYNLAGAEVQSIASGHINNVDVRQNVATASGPRDLAVGSNRSNNAITVYGIHPRNGRVTEIGAVATNLDEVYGICLYKNRSNRLYAFINDKDGRYQQFALDVSSGELSGELVREFILMGQPEACVADDHSGRLYMGEEGRGVWLTQADPEFADEPELVLEVGGALQADVEGLGLYHGAEASHLIVSSQGDDSYAVYDSRAPFAYRGSFRVAANLDAAIDGASETDGLEVVSANLDGPYSQGLVVVQDGRNVMPLQPQNFKLVPWSAIAGALQLP